MEQKDKRVRVTRTTDQRPPRAIRRLGQALVALAQAQLEAEAQAQTSAKSQPSPPRPASNLKPKPGNRAPGDAA
jgi:hypothetical protein